MLIKVSGGLEKELKMLLKMIERSEKELVMLIKVLGLLHLIFLGMSERVSVIKALRIVYPFFSKRLKRELIIIFWPIFW